MQFIKKSGKNAAICLHCFLTIRPKPDQKLSEAQKEHVCGRSENDEKHQASADPGRASVRDQSQ